MITKTRVHRAYVGNKKGCSFSIYFNGLEYPTIKGALYKTQRKASEKLKVYIETGKFESYGDAE